MFPIKFQVRNSELMFSLVSKTVIWFWKQSVLRKAFQKHKLSYKLNLNAVCFIVKERNIEHINTSVWVQINIYTLFVVALNCYRYKILNEWLMNNLTHCNQSHLTKLILSIQTYSSSSRRLKLIFSINLK